jgi:hypothetical protein
MRQSSAQNHDEKWPPTCNLSSWRFSRFDSKARKKRLQKVMKAMKAVLGIVLGLMLAGTASADSVWSYAGNTMNGCNGAMDGSVTLGADGSALRVVGADVTLFTEFYGSAFEATDSRGINAGINWGLFGYLEENRGRWTASVTADEPATGLLVAVALACAGLLRRGKKKPKDTTVWENLG